MSSPTPAPSPTPDIAGTVVHGVWTGITTAAAQNPWIVVVLGLLVVVGMARTARVAIHDGTRDQIRLFPKADKALLLAWAGHRCEHHGPFGGRCRSTEKLEADHVHPWSRGGSTHVRNGQILCKEHNQQKRAAIPWNRSLRRMSDRRAAYYPPDVDRVIVRRTRHVDVT